jgi:ribosomal-protein-alanine N-acetyltransferase
MPEIDLLNITPELVADLARSSALPTTYDLYLGQNADLITEIATQTETHRRATGAEPRWGGYLAVDASTRAVIGTCAYKGAPDENGAVELAYFTFPSFEGRGFATAMAHALAKGLAESGEARLIVAHTLPEENASTRILRKLEYRYVGEVDHPEDGRVWRWERPVLPGLAA